MEPSSLRPDMAMSSMHHTGTNQPLVTIGPSMSNFPARFVSNTPSPLPMPNKRSVMEWSYAQDLRNFWDKQMETLMKQSEEESLGKTPLPITRIKKIAKSDEDVKLLSAEVPLLLEKACELFIQELTVRSYFHARANSVKIIRRDHISSAIASTDCYDFLVDIVPKEPIVDKNISKLESLLSGTNGVEYIPIAPHGRPASVQLPAVPKEIPPWFGYTHDETRGSLSESQEIEQEARTPHQQVVETGSNGPISTPILQNSNSNPSLTSNGDSQGTTNGSPAINLQILANASEISSNVK